MQNKEGLMGRKASEKDLSCSASSKGGRAIRRMLSSGFLSKQFDREEYDAYLYPHDSCLVVRVSKTRLRDFFDEAENYFSKDSDGMYLEGIKSLRKKARV